MPRGEHGDLVGKHQDDIQAALLTRNGAGMPYATRTSHALNRREVPVYWLLLPVEANAQRHFANETGPSKHYLVRLWASFERLLFRAKSRRT